MIIVYTVDMIFVMGNLFTEYKVKSLRQLIHDLHLVVNLQKTDAEVNSWIIDILMIFWTQVFFVTM